MGRAGPEISLRFPRNTFQENQLPVVLDRTKIVRSTDTEASMPPPVLIVTAIGSGLVLGFFPVLIETIKPCLRQLFPGQESKTDHADRWLYLFWVPFMPIAG